jgi:RNA polymerase sigma-70 factor (ECF subfamily)
LCVSSSIGNFRLGAEGHALALTGWIFRIAHNLVIDEYRREKVRGEMDSWPDDWEEATAPEFAEDFHLTRADLQMALRRLTDEQQTVILMRFEEGMTSAEIARILGKTETAVKALQRRGLASLARYLAPNAPLPA